MDDVLSLKAVRSFKPVGTSETTVEVVTLIFLYPSAGSPPLPQLGGTSVAAPPGGPLPPPAYVPLSAAAPEKTLDSPAIQTNRTLTNATAATSSVCGPVNIAMTADSW